MDNKAFGAWLYIDYLQDNSDSNKSYTKERSNLKTELAFEGEFIGIDSQQVFIIRFDEVQKFRFNTITYAHLQTRENYKGSLAAWSFLGAISTVSNGLFLAITFPTWFIGGIAATVNESRQDIYTIDVPGPWWWNHYSVFARFPQGIPKNLDLKNLKSKKY